MSSVSTTLRAAVLRDLSEESEQVESWVRAAPEAWLTPTPAGGWTVAHQVAHLAWTDHVSLLAGRSSPAFARELERFETLEDAYSDFTTASLVQLPRPQLLARWSAQRLELRDWLLQLGDEVRIPWFGTSMGPTSMATARFMETWAHALDVYEALGIDPERSDRIRHVAHLGVRTRDFAYSVHGLPAPSEEFRIDLVSPSEEQWSWGPEDAAQTVTGSAWDFCLLVTQRVHRDDTDLVASGADAEQWLTIAQAFAGPAGEGRPRDGGAR